MIIFRQYGRIDHGGPGAAVDHRVKNFQIPWFRFIGPDHMEIILGVYSQIWQTRPPRLIRSAMIKRLVSKNDGSGIIYHGMVQFSHFLVSPDYMGAVLAVHRDLWIVAHNIIVSGYQLIIAYDNVGIHCC